MSTQEGIIYVGTGDKCLAEAQISAESLRSAMPNIEISIYSDRRPTTNVFDRVQLLDNAFHSTRDKVAVLPATPYERTVYLDTDTYVAGDISELFGLLDRFDLLIAHDPTRETVSQPDIPSSFPEMCCGLIAYRSSPAVIEFFKTWKVVHDEQCKAAQKTVRDQTSFRRLLYESDLRIYVIPPEFHCMIWEPVFLQGKARVIHGRHEHDTLADIASDANSISGGRVFAVGVGTSYLRMKSDVCRWAWRCVTSALKRRVRRLIG